MSLVVVYVVVETYRESGPFSDSQFTTDISGTERQLLVVSIYNGGLTTAILWSGIR